MRLDARTVYMTFAVSEKNFFVIFLSMFVTMSRNACVLNLIISLIVVVRLCQSSLTEGNLGSC